MERGKNTIVFKQTNETKKSKIINDRLLFLDQQIYENPETNEI